MRVSVNKKEYEWFKTMREEGRTRSIKINTYPTLNPETNQEIELELREVKK